MVEPPPVVRPAPPTELAAAPAEVVKPPDPVEPPRPPNEKTPPPPPAAVVPAMPPVETASPTTKQVEVKATDASTTSIVQPRLSAAAPAPVVSPPPAPVSRPAAALVAVARAGEVTRAARPRGGYQVIPSYPPSARREGIEGTTLLRVLVLADGHVGEVTVKKSAGHQDLDQAATDAVRQWRFDPARKGADAVAMWVLLPVEFHLKD